MSEEGLGGWANGQEDGHWGFRITLGKKPGPGTQACGGGNGGIEPSRHPKLILCVG